MIKVLIVLLISVNSFGGAEPEGNLCDTLAGDLQVICYNGVVTGVITCEDYPGDLQETCYNGRFNPDNGKYYEIEAE
jgi:hypothetical protein